VSPRSNDTAEHVAAILRGYVASHPDAADTLDGIARWWFPAAVVPEVMRSAVERLVAEGTLRRRESADGTVVYAAAGTWNGRPHASTH
jgi:hypothetical protein